MLSTSFGFSHYGGGTEKRKAFEEKHEKIPPKKQTNVFLPASSCLSCLNITPQSTHTLLSSNILQKQMMVPLNILKRINKEGLMYYLKKKKKMQD